MPTPALLPAATFPPLRWFQLAAVTGSRICIHENYVKQSLRNRIALVSSQGPKNISLPVHRRHATTRGLNDILFTQTVGPELLLKSLRTNCGSAPYFKHYMPEVEEWAETYLHAGLPWLDAALASTHWACQALGLPDPTCTTAFEPGEGWDDWRPKTRWKALSTPRYPQVFEDRLGFVEGRSILDVLFHVGPEATSLPSPHGNPNSASNGPA